MVIVRNKSNILCFVNIFIMGFAFEHMRKIKSFHISYFSVFWSAMCKIRSLVLK